MMQMLHAGGLPCFGEGPSFEEDENLPYSMTEPWLRQQIGKAVKILDPHLAPCKFSNVPRCVIWLDRNHREQAKSFVKFGRIVGGLPFSRRDVGPLAKGLQRDRPLAQRSLGTDQCETLFLTFENIIRTPLLAAEAVGEFLQVDCFDTDAAASVVRKRTVDCYKGLLEAELV